MFDTIDKDEWKNMKNDMIKVNTIMNRKRSIQVLNEIRSEINSEHYES